jgi:hypothetical protein
MTHLANEHRDELIGSALQTRLNQTSQAPSKMMAELLARLERATFSRQLTAEQKPPRETGQEIADRAGLFSAGEAVKRRVGI